MDWDALFLSRLQFAFTIAFHIIFPAFTIGLASFLAVVEGLWLKTRRDVYQRLYLFWVKVFAIAFGMGVVSGVVMSYQFGTNWSVFSDIAFDVIGPLLAYEVLTAFFLEASFLGVMLFGWKRVGERLHFAATVIVALGTLLSAFWILSANSWMQTPAGFAQTPQGLEATNYWDVIFNPSFPIRYVHMVIAAYLTTALVVAGACAFQYLRGSAGEGSRVGLRMATLLIAIAAPLQVWAGHASGEITQRYQPSKLAAMEGWWESGETQDTILFGWPNRDTESNGFQIAIPNTSGLLFHLEEGEQLLGLKAFPPEDRPPVWPVFWSFRIMVGIGLFLVVLGFWAAVQWRRGRLDRQRLLHWAFLLTSPLGFVAILAGWIVTEVGRQPYVIFGILRTEDAVSPVSAGQVATSLSVFLASYAIIFTAGALYILRLLSKGPDTAAAPVRHDRPPGVTFGALPPEADPDEGPRP